MKNNLFPIATFLVFLAASCGAKKESATNLTFIKNLTEIQRKEVAKIGLTSELSIAPGSGKIGSVPAEAVDKNDDGVADFLLAKVTIAPMDSVGLDLSLWTPD